MKKILFGFKVYYLLYVLAAFTAFLNGYSWLNMATIALTIFGTIVLLYMCIRIKLYWKGVGFWWVAAFLLSHIFSSVMSLKYGVTDNVKEVFWLAFPMMILYAMSFQYTKEEIHREMKILSIIYVFWTSIASVVSLSMICWGEEYTIGDGSGGIKVIGFKWGRLWGVFDDPNHGATIIVVGIILAVYLCSITKKKYVKVLLSFAILLQYLYLVFSDSRTGEVTLVTALFVLTCGLIYVRLRNKGKGIAIGGAILLSFIMAVSALGVSYGTKKAYNKIEQQMLALEQAKHADKKKANKKQTNLQLGRGKELEEDTSNGRRSIWESGVEITFTSPIYGVSFRNMTKYAKENLPQTYIVNTPGGGNYDSLHNVVMDVMVSQGIVGLLIVGGLAVSIMLALRKKWLLKDRETFLLQLTCLTIVLSLLAGSLFLSMVLYLNSPQAFIFWACLGYLVAFVSGEGKKIKGDL